MTIAAVPSHSSPLLDMDTSLALGPAVRRDIVTGLVIAGSFFGVFLGWAAFAPLDAASVSRGTVTVSGHRQTVQSRDGGMIAELRVHEGQKVSAGQVLLSLGDTDVRAIERSLASRVIHRQVEIARLRAEEQGRGIIAPPPEMALYTGENRVDADAALKAAQSELTTQIRASQTRRAVLGSRVIQIRNEIDGFSRQAESNTRQQALNQEELNGVRELAAKGYVPQTRIRALERTAAGLIGDAGAQASQMAKLNASIGETHLQIAQGDSERAQAVAQDLRAAEADLQILLPQWKAAREQLAHTQVKAPVSGVVVGLGVNTVGGVVAPGQKLMDVVPEHSRLVVEAKISPKDAAPLHLGQEATIRFSDAHTSNMPPITGRIERLSADTFTDERTGATYYVASIAADPSVLNATPAIQAATRPGQMVQVTTPLRKRSALQYWFEPLTRSLWRSFREN